MYDLRAAIHLNTEWFCSVSRELLQAETTVQLRAAICLALVEHISQDCSSATREPLLQLLGVLGDKNPGELWKDNLEYALICALIQQKYLGQPSPGFMTLIERVNQDLGQIGPEKLPTRFKTVPLLLHRLSRGPIPQRPDIQWPEDLYGLLKAESAELLGLCNAIGLASDFGQIPLDAPEGLEAIPEGLKAIIEAQALAAWKAYDIAVAAPSARALACLGERSSPAVKTIREFILQNQCNDGSFGFLGQEIFEAQMKGANFPGLKLQVPFALESLWTLAETDSRPYSLRHQIGANPSPVPSDSHRISETPRPERP